jgi:hypothetical protein
MHFFLGIEAEKKEEDEGSKKRRRRSKRATNRKTLRQRQGEGNRGSPIVMCI